MRKILFLLIMFFIASSAVFSADMRFVQVDSAMFSINDEGSVKRLEKIVGNINKQKNVDFVLFTGDNIAKASPDNLGAFLKISNNLKSPYYLVLGSKDANKQKNLSKKEYYRIVSSKSKTHKKIKTSNYVIEKKDIVFIVVDGSKDVIPMAMGYYKADVLQWLETQLSYYKSKNVVIIQHFPLIPPAQKETRITIKPEEYLNLLNNYDNVKAIFAGNFNVNSEKKVGNVLHVTTADAPRFRIVDIMDCETETPTFWSVIKE